MRGALSAQIRAFIDENLSESARSAALAQFARDQLAGYQDSGRAGKTYKRIVDGTADAPESAVRGDGTGRIVYLFSYQVEATVAALAYLRGRVPVRSGDYRDSFYVGIDGRFVPAAQFRPSRVPPTAEIVIGNTEAYSRRLDVQLDGGKVLHFSRPPGVFDDAARYIRRVFKGQVDARRAYTMRFPGQYVLRTGDRAGKLVHSPALVLNPRV